MNSNQLIGADSDFDESAYEQAVIDQLNKQIEQGLVTFSDPNFEHCKVEGQDSQLDNFIFSKATSRNRIFIAALVSPSGQRKTVVIKPSTNTSVSKELIIRQSIPEITTFTLVGYSKQGVDSIMITELMNVIPLSKLEINIKEGLYKAISLVVSQLVNIHSRNFIHGDAKLKNFAVDINNSRIIPHDFEDSLFTTNDRAKQDELLNILTEFTVHFGLKAENSEHSEVLAYIDKLRQDIYSLYYIDVIRKYRTALVL